MASVFSSFASRLILLLTLCSGLVVGAGLWLDYRLSRADIIQRVSQESEETIANMVADLENLLDGVEGSTLFLGRIVQQRDHEPTVLEELVRDVVENSDDIYGATIALNPALVEDPLGFAPYYYRRDGLVVSKDLRQGDKPYWQRPWFREAATGGEPRWVEPYFDKEGGETLMTTYSVPVIRPGGVPTAAGGGPEPYAVVTADITLADLQGYLQRLNLGSSGFGILLSRAGVVLSSRIPGQIMHHYAEVVDPTELPFWQQLIEQVQDGGSATGRIECPGLSGRCVVRMGALQSTGWPVGVIYSEDELLEPLRRFQRKTLVVGSLILLVVALAVALVSRRLTRPLSALAEASGEIAHGRLNGRLPTPRGEDELAQLIRSFAAMQTDLKAHIERLEQATASRSRLEGELAAAREIQMAMLLGEGEAREQLAGLDLWAKVLPAKSVGGDFYSFHLQGRRLLFSIGDVSDKGVPAALFMAKALSHMQQLAREGLPPAQRLARLNNLLVERNRNYMFVTLCTADLDLDSGQFEFASGGHPPPLLLRDGAVTELAQDMGPALGLSSGLSFATNLERLEEDDCLLLYTDGVDEAFNESGDMFGLERLHTLLSRQDSHDPEELGGTVFQAVRAFSGEAPQSDDITVLVLSLRDSSEPRRLELAAGHNLVGRTLEWLQGQLAVSQAPDDCKRELLLVAEEIITNLDRYAGLEEGDTVQVALAEEDGELCLTVTDPGKPFDPLSEGQRAELGRDSATAGVGGLGVHLITQLSDRQTYRRVDGRNILQVYKALPV